MKRNLLQGREGEDAWDALLERLLHQEEEKLDELPDALKKEVMDALAMLEFFAEMADLFTHKFLLTELEALDGFLSEEEE